MYCHASEEGDVHHKVCQQAPTKWTADDQIVFLNALSSDMPSCDRKENATTLENLEHADTCYVYCAQHSCGAAKKYMQEHRDELRQKCDNITYLTNGALSMNRDSLVDGKKCHDQIIEYNKKNTNTDKACLTCIKDSQPIDNATYDNKHINVRYSFTDDSIPDWYIRNGIYSPLPPIFTCDKRFHPPVMHNEDRSILHVNLENKGLPKDAILAYWAAKPNDEKVEAHRAYGDFSNSGIIQCDNYECDIPVAFPGIYTEHGETFNPHVHFTHWKGDRWDTVAKTIEFV